ncbi:MAG: DUF2062 domain-containing protein [Pseudomonadota bacterium]
MKFQRQLKYYYLRFIRLRGEPHELALGMALGIFSGMMPILPFQTAVAVALAMLFKGSKITAALGTWISNPLNWYFLYYYSYKLGVLILGDPEKGAVFSSVMIAIRSGEESMVILKKILGAGGLFVSTFLLGGLVMAVVAAPPSYLLFLHIFKRIRSWRRSRRGHRKWGPRSSNA